MSERSKHKKQQQNHTSSSLSSSSPSSFADDKLIKKRPSLLTLKYLLSPTTRSVILLNLIIFLTFSLFLFHYLWLSSRTCLLPPNSSRTTTKIYVYELPRKFTYGVIESYHLARAPSRFRSLSDGGDNLIRYPGHQHSAEWYLFSDLNRSQHLRPGGGSPVVLRVSDPEKADLFFVPFFSSLSLIANPKSAESLGCGNDGNELCYSDERMQEEVMDWLEKQRFWKRNNGRDHVFVCQDPNAMGKVSERLRNAVLLVSDFGRLRGDQASLVKDVIVPYFHRINSFKGDVGVDGRSTLLFFMGNRYRKEGGKIRDLLFQILEGEKDVIIKHGAQSRESRRVATQGMHTSKFCLHPAGDTPSACRLFDAIVSLCIPVIVSDYIELPFEDIVDYTKLAVFVDTQKAIKRGYLTKLLRKTSTERILRYQKEIKAVRHYFEYEDTNGTTVYEIWRQVNLKVPLIKLMINRDKRLVERKLEYSDCSCICSTANRTVSFSHDHKQKLR